MSNITGEANRITADYLTKKFEKEHNHPPKTGSSMYYGSRLYVYDAGRWLYSCKYVDPLGEENNLNKPNMKKTIEISLYAARKIHKTYKTFGDTNTIAPIGIVLIHDIILDNFTKEELEGNKGYTFEESFNGSGYAIIQEHGVAGHVVTGHKPNSPMVKHIFKTKGQAESALAFAQLSHIVAKYNEGKTGCNLAYTIKLKMSKNTLFIDALEYDDEFPHLAFLTSDDAYTSMQVNKELWNKYHMRNE